LANFLGVFSKPIVMKKLFLLLSCFLAIAGTAQTSLVVSDITTLRSTSGSASNPAANLLGYNSPGDGGGGNFVWLTSLPSGETPDGDILIQPTSGGGYWKRIVDQGYYNVKWFGAKASLRTSTTPFDNIDAFEKAASFALKIYEYNTPNSFGSRVFIPGDKDYYYISRTWVWAGPMEVFGESGVSGDQAMGTKIRVAAGQKGFVIKFRDPVTHAVKAPYSSIKNLLLYSDDFATPAVNTAIHGIDAISILNCYKVSVKGFTGNGFNIYGNLFVNSEDPTQGNSSMSEFYSCSAASNGQHGFAIEGEDAQVCTFIGCDSRNNKNWGFFERSTYGNTYITCVTHSNGTTVAQGQGGGFTINNGGINSSLFLNCYSEADQNGNTSATNYGLRINPMGQVWDRNSPIITGEASWVTMQPGFKVSSPESDGFEIIGYVQPDLPGVPGSGNKTGLGIHAKGDASDNAFTWDGGLKMYVNRFGNSNGYWSYAIPGRGFDPALVGRSSNEKTMGKIMFPRGIGFRDYANSQNGGLNFRMMLMQSKAPAATDPVPILDEYAKGDVIVNSSGIEGEPFAWRCIQSGTPGTWEEVRTAVTYSGTASTNGNNTISVRVPVADNSLATLTIHTFGKSSTGQVQIDQRLVKVKRVGTVTSIVSDEIADETSEITGTATWWVEVDAGTGEIVVRVSSSSAVNWKTVVEKKSAVIL